LSSLNFAFNYFPLVQVQLKAESCAREVLRGDRMSSSATIIYEEPSTAAPMNIPIDPAWTHSKNKRGDAGGNTAGSGEV
jgi:hypothetical protein